MGFSTHTVFKPFQSHLSATPDTTDIIVPLVSPDMSIVVVSDGS